MSTKDYVAVALVISTLGLGQPELDRLVSGLVGCFKRDNRLFKADKFATACGATANYGY